MTYSLRSYSILILTLSLAFVLAYPTLGRKHKSRHQKIKFYCAKTKDHQTCKNLLESDSRTENANNVRLTEVAIDLAYKKAQDIQKELYRLRDSTSNDNRKDQYAACSKNYSDAIRDLDRTRTLFNDRDYKRIPVQAKDAAQEVEDCRDQFEKSSSGYSNLKKDSKEFQILVDVIRVVSEELDPRD